MKPPISAEIARIGGFTMIVKAEIRPISDYSAAANSLETKTPSSNTEIANRASAGTHKPK